ncbi:RNA-binding protein [Arsenicicoccus sp. oral taxon 190]|nr:RNA-binding protein [Arsenicicoccus sp. oral taxon 190]
MDPDAARLAAADALLRARSVAKAKGLRPGSAPRRRRRPSEVMLSGSAVEVDGRDPLLLGDTLARLVAGRGWQSEVKVGSVMGRWPQVVGADVAEHSEPLTFDDGVLTVRASSTAWATQLRLMTSSILGRLAAEVGEGVVEELRVVGPTAPRWSRGPRRSSDGRGPRDTYG